ncbi:MAG TPA: DUF1707 domain-containing protein [Gemmatimonadaceae bacterium]|nr:DUF1707 domain-containing protein [Gemmatimonadaceae bacterium]
MSELPSTRGSRALPPDMIPLRERVIAQLTDHFAADRLNTGEFEARLELAFQARSAIEFEELVADLGPLSPSAPAGSAAVSTGQQPRGQVVWALFAAVARKGAWLVPRRLVGSAVMGSVVLDMRDAVLTSQVTEIRAFALFGSVEVVLPPHVRVETDGLAVFGGFEDRARTPTTADPTSPIVRVGGFALFGAVEVKVREVGSGKVRGKGSG